MTKPNDKAGPPSKLPLGARRFFFLFYGSAIPLGLLFLYVGLGALIQGTPRTWFAVVVAVGGVGFLALGWRYLRLLWMTRRVRDESGPVEYFD